MRFSRRRQRERAEQAITEAEAAAGVWYRIASGDSDDEPWTPGGDGRKLR